MKQVVISGTGLFTPPLSISNDELVAAFNAYVAQYNERNAAAIERGEFAALAESALNLSKNLGVYGKPVRSIERHSDPERMAPSIPERSNDELSVPGRDGRGCCARGDGQCRQDCRRHRCGDCGLFQYAAPYPAMAIGNPACTRYQWFGFDMNVACSSATFGIEQAANAVKAGTARVLMVKTRNLFRPSGIRDRDCHFIFGDVCMAVIVEKALKPQRLRIVTRLSGTKLATVFSNNIRNNFGFLNRCDESGIGARDKLFVQEGRKVFGRWCRWFAEHITTHLQQNQVQAAGARFWLHQANLSMNLLISKRVLGRDADTAGIAGDSR